MDLLRKSRAEGEFEVVDTGDKVKAQTETFAATAVALTEDAPHLELGVDVFDTQPQLA